jgi:hypothetical protein
MREPLRVQARAQLLATSSAWGSLSNPSSARTIVTMGRPRAVITNTRMATANRRCLATRLLLGGVCIEAGGGPQRVKMEMWNGVKEHFEVELQASIMAEFEIGSESSDCSE